MVNDPTYDMEAIKSNRTWHVAWVLSEIRNDRAPIGWGKYLFDAQCLLQTFNIVPKQDEAMSEEPKP